MQGKPKASTRKKPRSNLEICKKALNDHLLPRENNDVYGEISYELYHLPSKILVDLRDKRLLKVWSGNRIIDKDRVEEIREWQNEIGRVLGTLHFAYLQEEGLVCYDGNHRLQALDAGLEVLVEVIWDANPQIVSDYNSRINALQEVPEVNKNPELRSQTTLLDAVNEFMQWMEDNFSRLKVNGTKRPRWNVTKLTEKITEIYQAYGDQYTYEEIFEAIKHLNTCLGDKTRTIKYISNKREPTGPDKDIAEQIKFYLYFPPDPLSDSDVKWALNELYGS